jgi:hypothetical protein
MKRDAPGVSVVGIFPKLRNCCGTISNLFTPQMVNCASTRLERGDGDPIVEFHLSPDYRDPFPALVAVDSQVQVRV